MELETQTKYAVRIAAYLLSVALVFPWTSQAACGLNFCPRHEESKRALQMGLAINQAGFRAHEKSGSYTEATPEIQYNLGGKWVLGVHAPIVLLRLDGAEVGLGNPMGYAEYRVMPGSARDLRFGLQTEVPLGNSHEGIADAHFMVVPYLSWRRSVQAFFFGGNLGGGFAVAGEHRHSPEDGSFVEQVYVRPHEEMELLYRATAGTRWSRKASSEIFINGLHVLHGETKNGNHFLTIGCAVPISLGSISMTPGFEIPALAARRMEWSFGLKLKVEVGTTDR